MAVQGGEAKVFAYEVTSVKPSRPGEASSAGFSADHLSYTGATLMSLIAGAYGVYQPGQIIGMPGWAESEHFDVQAKMDENSAAALEKLQNKERWEQQKLMMQSLLADRFQLKVHRETRELPIYALVIAKGGPKLQDSVSTHPGSMSFSPGRLSFEGATIDSLAMNVAPMVGRIVVNRTGLTGKYDVKLNWSPDDMRGPILNGESAQAETGPSIFTALREELGLKLESQKWPVTVVVVDHAEHPSEN